uniref:PemK-like protein n=1 Tax=Siphoviridae sp. ctL0q1 TaxID=2825449 RepID=A0A8S5PJS9_9CAUD|nr:MAG TPA: PemK-like protein [Siphoviridae sp. ctL0q1]
MKIMNKYEALYRWSCHKMKIQENFERNNQIHIKYPRGAVYTCYMGVNIGHEKSRLEARPCLIVSTDEINKKSSNVIIVPLSKEIKYKKDSATELAYPWHYVLQKAKYSKLTYDSVVQCEDLRCVSKSRMGKFIMKIDPEDLGEIKKRLKRTLQL